MVKAVRFRFWLESIMATITGILFVITIVWRNWIEIMFGIDLDRGSGALEWLIVVVLFVVTVTLFALARNEWRKAHAAI